MQQHSLLTAAPQNSTPPSPSNSLAPTTSTLLPPSGSPSGADQINSAAIVKLSGIDPPAKYYLYQLFIAHRANEIKEGVFITIFWWVGGGLGVEQKGDVKEDEPPHFTEEGDGIKGSSDPECDPSSGMLGWTRCTLLDTRSGSKMADSQWSK
nr:unnamed protein product [Digitaria exilis]